MAKIQEAGSLSGPNKDELTDPKIEANESAHKNSGDHVNMIFSNIIANVSIDYNNKEIQDIQYAIHTMLERIVSKVNDRGSFSIARIQPAGSMAEKTSIWKYHKEREEHYLEFDFLAVLLQSVRQCIDTDCGDRCPGCITLKNAPVNSEQPLQYEIRGRTYTSESASNPDVYNGLFWYSELPPQCEISRKRRPYTLESASDPYVYNELFLYEINKCLSSLCNCLITSFVRGSFIRNKIQFQNTGSKQDPGCDKCTVDMPTGTLTANTSSCVDPSNNGPSNCSLIFLWTSKANSLSAPDRQFLHKHHQLRSLPVYVDFLPALESLKQVTLGEEIEHDCFLVPKHCNTAINKCKGWRKSSCLAEINVLSKNESKTHRNCFQMIKFIVDTSETRTTWVKRMGIGNYDVKTAMVKHCLTCSNSSDRCKCVIEISNGLYSAYDLGELETCDPSPTRCNLLANKKHCDLTKIYFKQLSQLLQSLGSEDTTETFIQRLTEMPCPSSGNT